MPEEDKVYHVGAKLTEEEKKIAHENSDRVQRIVSTTLRELTKFTSHAFGPVVGQAIILLMDNNGRVATMGGSYESEDHIAITRTALNNALKMLDMMEAQDRGTN